MSETKIRVCLLRHTPEPEALIATAAKLCYAADAQAILQQEAGSAQRFVRKLAEMGHMSPIEHVAFTFYIEGVSRAMTHQLVRHRVASYSQRSQRYVKHDEFEYVAPPKLQGKTVTVDGKDIPAETFFRESMADAARRYHLLNEALGDSGETSNEDARYILPNACETKIIVTMNARELLHFFEERLCNRAQWEIRFVADEMRKRALDVCPAVFDGRGPKCLRHGGCPEGKMGCGQYEAMKNRYCATGLRKGE